MFLKILNYIAAKLNNKIKQIEFNNQFNKQKLMTKDEDKKYQEKYRILFLAAEGYRERNNYNNSLIYYQKLQKLVQENRPDNTEVLNSIKERITLLSRLMHEGEYIIN